MKRPSFDVALADGTRYQLTDLAGNAVRLEDLRGKAVWVNFFASWCPPCQGETPVLRDLADEYRDRGLEVVAVSVQETAVEDVRAYAERYDLDYTIGFDGSGHVFRTYRVYALPTQFFLDTNGVIRFVVQGPLETEGATQRIEALLPAAIAPSDSAGLTRPTETVVIDRSTNEPPSSCSMNVPIALKSRARRRAGRLRWGE